MKKKANSPKMEPADPATPKKAKTRILKDASSLSRAHLLVFALVFAAIGGYALYHSFAATPLIASLEGEQMSQPTGSKIVTDTTASGGKALELTPVASSGTTNPTAKPAIPTGLTAIAGNGSVTLNWSANPFSDQVNAYQVYYGNDSTFTNFNGYVPSVAGTSYTVTGLTNGTTYYFRVSAHNAVGYGPWSATSVGATPRSGTTNPTAKPAIPTGLTAIAGNGSVTLNWSANPFSDQVNAYQVYYGNDSTFTNFNGYVPSVAGTSYTVTGLTNGTTYYFRVSAHNAVGYGPWSATSVGATPTATITPPSTVDLALNKPATSSSVESGLSTLVASNAFDGNTATRWSSNYSDPQWVEVDLGSTQTISSVVITWTTAANSWEVAYAKAYQIQTSNDNKTWTTIYSTSTGAGGTQTLSVNGSGRYVRMYGTQRASTYGYSLWEMAVYGPGTTNTGATGTPAAAPTAGSPVTTTGSVNFPSSVTSLTVTAKGDQCSGAPQMNVAVDGTTLISAASVSNTSWTTFTANDSLASGVHSLSVTFTNPLTSSTCARDLYIDVTNFYGPNPTTTPAPTVSLSATPPSVTAGSSSTLTWNAVNTSGSTPCTASGAWSGLKAASGSVSTGALNQSSTYTLVCTGSGGSGSQSATVTVTQPSGGGTGTGSSYTVHGMYDSDGTQAAFTADWPAIAAQDINTLILPSEWISNLQTLKAAGDSAWVTAGYWDDAAGAFSLSQAQAVADVTAACATGVVKGIYVADEPSNGAATIKTRAAALKAACPSAYTVIAYYDAGTVASWKGVTDVIALDIYPSRDGFNDSLITQLAAAADAAGIPYYGVVGAFTDGTSNYPLPTAAQLSAMFSAWESTHELGWLVYSWGAAGGATSTQLQNQPSLLSVIKANADK